MYLELILAIREIYDQLPCDICGVTGSMRRFALDARAAALLGIPHGIYHPSCSYALAMAIQQETQEQ